MNKSSQLWAIAGGKGGTGKSFVTSALGILLAKMGHKTILIDSDLGGANLHSFIGIDKPSCSLSDFFDKNIKLEDILLSTNMDNLSMISGDINSFSPYSMKYFQKMKLFRQIRNLNSEFVLIDLGAGSSLNVIDTLLLSDKMIVVVTPQITSYENLYQLVTKILFRKIGNALKELDLKKSIFTIWNERESVNIMTFNDFLTHLKSSSNDVREAIEKSLSTVDINIVFNQVRDVEDIRNGLSLKSLLIKQFGISSKYSGFINYNDTLWKSIHQAFSILYSNSSTSAELYEIINNLIENKHIKLTSLIQTIGRN